MSLESAKQIKPVNTLLELVPTFFATDLLRQDIFYEHLTNDYRGFKIVLLVEKFNPM